MIKGKSVEEIRKTFNIVNDFTPEEEEQIRKENGEFGEGCFFQVQLLTSSGATFFRICFPVKEWCEDRSVPETLAFFPADCELI
jgi:hypothetical protein